MTQTEETFLFNRPTNALNALSGMPSGPYSPFLSPRIKFPDRIFYQQMKDNGPRSAYRAAWTLRNQEKRAAKDYSYLKW
ncbi:hypothetical protein [Pelobacter seleniigenes]|uniref:hypothetical protein n=1 Tax=Pelobacter seleniigenes TaxID=407188 RepID=UPI0004A74762|nr:hypothetical protein [Pelobacter seleniigenes]